MRILIICNLYHPNERGGYEILCHEVIEELHSMGYELRVLTSESKKKSDFLYGVDYCLKLISDFQNQCSKSRLRRYFVDLYNYFITAKTIKSFQPDLVFVWSQLRLGLGASRAAEKFCDSVVYSFNDDHILNYAPREYQSTFRSFISYLLDRYIFPSMTTQAHNFDKSICVSHHLKNLLEKRLSHLTCSKVIYQGIRVDHFLKSRSQGRLFKILYLGQIYPYKGVHTILLALKHLQDQGVQLALEFNICGGGDEQYIHELKVLADSLSITCNFLGRIDHNKVHHVLAKNDVLVFPSIWQEPFGLSHLEAMASNVVVISTDQGGCGEFLKDQDNCLIFEKENHLDLAERLKTLHKNSDLYQRLRTNGVQTVENSFSFNRYINELKDYLSIRRAYESNTCT